MDPSGDQAGSLELAHPPVVMLLWLLPSAFITRSPLLVNAILPFASKGVFVFVDPDVNGVFEKATTATSSSVNTLTGKLRLRFR